VVEGPERRRVPREDAEDLAGRCRAIGSSHAGCAPRALRKSVPWPSTDPGARPRSCEASIVDIFGPSCPP
jgi:hypothetical protein